jgi:hypothetical protein
MAQAQLQRATDAVSLIRSALAELQEMGEGFQTPGFFLPMRMNAQARSRTPSKRLIERVQQWPDMRVYQPEILRMRGELQFRNESEIPRNQAIWRHG